MSIERASSSVPSSSLKWKYDVFLSFRGKDTRKGFTNNLYTELVAQGIETFMDDHELQKGEALSPVLLTAIEESRFAFVVLSVNYASSTWCLDELLKILECMETRITALPVFYDVDPSDVRQQTGSFAEAFNEHEKRFRDDTDKLQGWRTALTKVSNFTGWNLKDWRLFRSVENLVGIDSRVEAVHLLSREGVHDVSFIGILGMGGIDIGIDVLVERSLLTVSFGTIWMHDLLQEMGLEIVRRESPEEPGKRSRLWLYEDINHVLGGNTGTDTVEAIVLDLDHIMDVTDEPVMHMNSKSFSKMNKLRLLEIRNVQLSKLCDGLEYLSTELRILRWLKFPLRSLPSSFNPEKIKEINLCHSQIVYLWMGIKHLHSLKTINLSHSLNLLEIPDLSGSTYLECLILEGCIRLTEVDSSVGMLERLTLLNLTDCTSLCRLPCSVSGLKSLKVLLSRCSKLENLLEDLGDVKSLEELDVAGTTMRPLPSCLGPLEDIIVLNFDGTKFFRWSSFAHLQSSRTLNISNCNIWDMGFIPVVCPIKFSLKRLNLSSNQFVRLPGNISQLHVLEYLDLQRCQYLEELPKLPPRIEALSYHRQVEKFEFVIPGNDIPVFYSSNRGSFDQHAPVSLSDEYSPTHEIHCQYEVNRKERFHLPGFSFDEHLGQAVLDHLWIFCSSLQSRQDWQHIEFLFTTDDQGLQVKKSGVRVVYHEDEEEKLNNVSQEPFTSSLGEAATISCATKRSPEHFEFKFGSDDEVDLECGLVGKLKTSLGYLNSRKTRCKSKS
ncbi:hypothetical protein ACLB2K_006420 [Fragaria x ananassa]